MSESEDVPGMLAPFHWTVSSPVPGLDSKLRSVGGDRAGGTTGTNKYKNRERGNRLRMKILFVLTCDNPACDRGSLLVAVNDRLNTVGVLQPRSQSRNVNTARVRGHVSRGFSALTGTHCQLR